MIWPVLLLAMAQLRGAELTTLLKNEAPAIRGRLAGDDLDLFQKATQQPAESVRLPVSKPNQGRLEADVDDATKRFLERTEAPGLSLAIVREGTPLLTKGYGFANVELKVCAKASTVY
jgi:CubicO group peptidase (beta-lactamase class C family)